MNREMFEKLVNDAKTYYCREFPYYLQVKRPKYLRLTCGSEKWNIDHDCITIDEEFTKLELFKSEPSSVANMISLSLILPYSSILSVMIIEYEDDNSHGRYRAYSFNVSGYAVPGIFNY